MFDRCVLSFAPSQSGKKFHRMSICCELWVYSSDFLKCYTIKQAPLYLEVFILHYLLNAFGFLLCDMSV